MKYYIITITILLLTAVGSASAQHVNLGIKGGLNSYTTDFNGVNFDSKLGVHLGLLGHIHLGDQFGLQPELVFSMQGAQRGDTKLMLDYINVPVLFQYMYDNGFRLQAGPQLGFLINSKIDNNGTTVDLKNETKSTDLGLSFGVSYVSPSTGFGVDARYNLGLTDISENPNFESTNKGFQFGVFYLFGHRN